LKKTTTCTTAVPVGGGPITTVNGVASFPNLTLWTVATGAVLQATATGLTSVNSSTFNVTANSDVVFRNGFETCTP
jgi:3-polyprenyl-4-hydroxybenzoate decarboxylase